MERKDYREVFSRLVSEMSKILMIEETDITMGREHVCSLYRSLIMYLMRQGGFKLIEIGRCTAQTPASVLRKIRQIEAILLNENDYHFEKIYPLVKGLRMFALPKAFLDVLRDRGLSDEEIVTVWESIYVGND